MLQSDDLSSENARLAARVAELEAELAAKPHLDRATLYRMTDNAPWGVAAVNLERTLDYANPALQRWLKIAAPATGRPLREALAPTLLDAIADSLERAYAGEPSEIGASIRDLFGYVRETKLTLTPRRDGGGRLNGVVLNLYDITETQALDRTVRDNEARLSRINAIVPSIIYIMDVGTGTPVWMGGRTGLVLGYPAEELDRNGAEIAATLVHPSDRPKLVDRILNLAKRPDGDVVEVEFRARGKDGQYRWVLDRGAVFERDAQGRVTRTISAAINIDDRKNEERRRSLLINELNHRVKNTLATVQSIARQTLRDDRSHEQTLEMFTSRLLALSSAHDVLTREHWEGASLAEVVTAALAPFETYSDTRIRVRGPSIRVSARAAVGIAMALHELATNAVKYGALSVESGHVTLDWDVVDTDAGADRLTLAWQERGGPPVTPPERKGFGSRLLLQGLAGELGGASALHFEPAGLTFTIDAPLQAAETAQTTA